jgi:hypothetical protein
MRHFSGPLYYNFPYYHYYPLGDSLAELHQKRDFVTPSYRDQESVVNLLLKDALIDQRGKHFTSTVRY